MIATGNSCYTALIVRSPEVKANTKNREVSHIMVITDEQKNLAQLFKFG